MVRTNDFTMTTPQNQIHAAALKLASTLKPFGPDLPGRTEQDTRRVVSLADLEAYGETCLVIGLEQSLQAALKINDGHSWPVTRAIEALYTINTLGTEAALPRLLLVNQTKGKMKNPITIGEKYGPAMEITSEADANAYFEELVHHSMEHHEKTRPEAEALERANLGYFAGYYSDETRARVERLFKCQHPVFGSIAKNGAPTAEQAFVAGVMEATK